MSNTTTSGGLPSSETADFLWQVTIALHVAFNLPEGEGLRHALGAPQAPNNKEALFTWVERQFRNSETAAWIPLMNEMVKRLHDQLQRQEQLLWV